MDMSKVIEAAIKAGALEQVSQMTGISQKDAGNVVNVVLPLLLKGMQSQAKSKDTQEGFIQALNDHGKNDPKDVKKFIKNVDTEDGAKIVNHLLGTSTEEVAAKAKKKSGLDTKDILKIMAILAPILMSKMGKTAKTESAKSGSDDMFGIVGGLLDGVDAGDVIKIVSKLMK
jgi:hypothetical protein